MLEIGDGYRAQNNELGGTGPIFLRAGHVTDSHIDFAGVEHFHEHLANKVRPKMSKVGDTIITTKGNSTGRTSFVTDRLPPFVYSPHLSYWRSRDPEKLCGGFLRYWSQGVEFIEQLSGMKTSTDMAPYLSLTDQRRLSVTLPPLAEQEAIAAVLGALDDKIELNRRMNATLEAMAQSLFQSWFVDFDPVRAKLDGRPPAAIDPATAALFPASFQGSEAGHIPKGWTIQPVGEVVNCVGGGTPSTAEPKYWQGTHHWTTPKDFSSLQAPVLLDTDRKLTDAGIAKISSGLLPAGTLLLSSRAPVGYLAIAAMPVAINQGFIALKCNERASNFFMLNWCQTNMAEIESRATGTTFAEISKQNFRPIRVVLPPKELMAAFTAKVAPFYAQITANLHQSHALATLRDTLLPKLLSGELTISTI
ncbi:MAG: restriction endonuclease subunit S [Candidatus Accumulibacter sp.]|uniref:Restriction endonuclease subunit S n=1 Tax=Candidatus Accumulibacter affinis TaxID=2954384 RepID=A0A935TGU5_9PROT|nr:restriction endonuclease subunit S [Candidatus Accumulibacter affinis]